MSPRNFDNDHEPDLGNEDLDLSPEVDEGPALNDWDDDDFEAGGLVGDDDEPESVTGSANGRYGNGRHEGEDSGEDGDSGDTVPAYVDEESDDGATYEEDEDELLDEEDELYGEDDDEDALYGDDEDQADEDDDEWDDDEGDDALRDELDEDGFEDSDDDEDELDDESDEDFVDDLDECFIEDGDDEDYLDDSDEDDDEFDEAFDELNDADDEESATDVEPVPSSVPDQPFHDEFHYALIEADDTVRSGLEQIINSCWYTDDLVVVAMEVPENQPACDAWVRTGLGEGFEVVTVTADLMMTADEIFDEVAAELKELGLHREPVVAGQKPRELVIHIDHAHELGAGVFDTLMSLVERSDIMVTPHIVLWGEQQAMNELDSLFDARNVQVSYVDVPRFSAAAVAAYLGAAWSQQVAGHSLPLSAQQCADLAQASGGQVDALDQLANEVVSRQVASAEAAHKAPALSGAGRVLKLVPRRHAMAALGLAGVLVLVLIFSRGEEAGLQSGNTTVVRLERVASPPAPSAAQSGAEPSYTPSPAASREAAGSPATAAPIESQAASLQPLDASANLSDQVESRAGVEEVVPGRDTAPAAQVNAGEQTAPDSSPVDSEAAPPAQRQVSNAVTATASRSPETGRLLSYPDDHYFIQLLGSFSEETVQQFIRDNMSLNGTAGQFFSFESRYQDRPWHVVVYGPFTTRALAEQARDGLPARVREGEPWIRSVADIRQSSPR